MPPYQIPRRNINVSITVNLSIPKFLQEKINALIIINAFLPKFLQKQITA
jgi:hypothetical protein